MNEHKMKEHAAQLVIALVGENLADKWWNSTNKAFDNQTPADEWQRNRNKVYEYLCLHAYGGW